MKKSSSVRQEKEARTGKKAGGRPPKPPVGGPRDKDQVNFTDEESRIMLSTEGFVQAYNAQAAVDLDSHLIVENHIAQQANDKQQIEPALERLSEMAERAPPWCNGYRPLKVKRCMPNAKRRLKQCSVSSKRCWGSGDFTFADWIRHKVNGISCAWHGI